jgi:hypothetical protein
MRRMAIFALSLGMTLGVPDEVGATGEDAREQAKRELLPRSVHLRAEAIPLSEALAELRRQTGNEVADRRHTKTDPKLNLHLENSTFWPALDAIAKAAGCGVSTYQPDQQVALVDAALPSVSTIYQGIFRISTTGLSVAQSAGTHICTITLDIAWEPRFEPLYLELGAIDAVFAADVQGVELQARAPAQGKFSVAGYNARAVEVRLPAPQRTSVKIKSLTGQFQLTGPAKMLTFTFPELKPMKKGEPPIAKSDEGVRVSLVELKAAATLWSVEMHIVNPPGNPPLESFQSWLGNNRITLEKGKGPARTIWPLRGPEDQLVRQEAATGAEIRYSFPIASKQNKGPPEAWTLVYRTPGPIVDIAAPFTFKDVPLP